MTASQARKIGSWTAVAATVIFQAVLLFPEISVSRHDLNDNVLHLAVIARMSDALNSGEDPLDCWHNSTSLGYPFHHSYPPLGHAAVVLIHRVLLESIELLTIFCWVRYLLVCLFPIPIFIGARWMGLGRIPAAATATLSCLISTDGLYGLEYGSYLWRGSGLYAQQWGAFLLPLALGALVRASREGRGRVLAGVLLALTFLGHIIYGYIAAISSLLVLIAPGDRPRRGSRLLLSLGVAFGLMAFFVFPFLQDREAINHSRWEYEWKWDSFGHRDVLTRLVRGNLFDEDYAPLLTTEPDIRVGRIPVLTLLVSIGTLLTLVRVRKSPTYCVIGFIFWTVVFFGRPTWGALMGLLPLSGDLPLHRLIGGVHLFGLLIAGWALGWIIRGLLDRKNYMVAIVTAGIVLAIPWTERVRFVLKGYEWGVENREAHLHEEEDVRRIVATIRQGPDGRVFPGRRSGWGKEFQIGKAPLYAVLTRSSVDCLAFLYHAMSLPSDLMGHFDGRNPAHCTLFHVSWVLMPDEADPEPFYTLAGEFGRFRLYRTPGGHPFQAVRSDVVYRGEGEDLYRIGKDWIYSSFLEMAQVIEVVPLDSPREALSVEDPLPFPDDLASGSPGEVIRSEGKGNTYRAQVDFREPGVLLLKQSYHPRWKITVDGEIREPILLTPGFCGVRLQPGTHEVSFVYTPQGWRIPLLLFGLLIAVGACITERRNTIERIEDRIASRLDPLGRRLSEKIRELRSGRTHIIALAGLVLLASLPLFQDRIHDGHDAREYVPRLVQFHENIRAGILVPRWAPDLSGGGGQPFFIFAPPLFYILAEAFHLLGTSLILATHMALLALVAISAAGAYLLGKEMAGRWGGLLCATAYIFAPYFLLDLYVRSAYAEFTALAFFPWALLGIHWLSERRSAASFIVAAAAIAAIMLSHNAAALIFIPFASFWVCVLALEKRSPPLIIIGGAAIAAGLALSAYFWVPALAERSHVWVERLQHDYLDFRKHYATLGQIIHSPWGYGVSVEGTEDGMSFTLGWFHLLIATAGVTVAASRKKMDLRTIALALGAMGAVFFTVSLSLPLWEPIPLLHYLAFPWRFLCLATICLAGLVGILPRLLPEGWRPIACIIALLGMFGTQIVHVGPGGYLPDREREYAPEEIARKQLAVTTKREYEPKTMTRLSRSTDAMAVFRFGDGEIEPLRRTPAHRRFRYSSPEGGTIRVILNDYPGWEVRVDGEVLPHHTESGSGRILFDAPAGDHQVDVRFRNTPVRAACNGTSVLTLIALVLLGITARVRAARGDRWPLLGRASTGSPGGDG